MLFLAVSQASQRLLPPLLAVLGAGSGVAALLLQQEQEQQQQQQPRGSGWGRGGAVAWAEKAAVAAAAAAAASGGVLLPTLTEEEEEALRLGKLVHRQRRTAREGGGVVAIDVAAGEEEVLETLWGFARYVTLVPTVRGVDIHEMNAPEAMEMALAKRRQERDEECGQEQKPGAEAQAEEAAMRASEAVPTVCATFTVSRFYFKLHVVHSLHREQGLIRFHLDPSRKARIFKKLDGYWVVQGNPPGRPKGWCRVWLIADVLMSRFVPRFFTDYVAWRALPRATNWIQPHFHDPLPTNPFPAPVLPR